METPQKQFYRDQLRTARAVAMADAEGFQAVLHILELIGQQLFGSVHSLGKYEKRLSHLADASPLSTYIPNLWPGCHTNFRALFSELRRARNNAVHQGAHARILTDHAVDVTIVIEDALMTEASMISQFMVREVIEAKSWQPVSYVRQQMLKYGISYLPIRQESTWWLIPEFSVARYLRGGQSPTVRGKRLATSVRNAVTAKELDLIEADTAAAETPILEILQCIGERPILIVDPTQEDLMIGILTSSDVM